MREAHTERLDGGDGNRRGEEHGKESATVDQSVQSAQRALDLSTAQYKAGLTTYLTVITAQTALVSAQRTQVDLLTNRLTASVQLVVSLGGGWDMSRLPSSQETRTASSK